MKPSNLRPFFAYLSESQYVALKQFANQTGVSITHLIREGVDARLSSGNLFLAGYNKGLQDAISAINQNNISKMTFPSGKTFGELIIDDISNLTRSANGTGIDHRRNPQDQEQQETEGQTSNPGAAT